MNIKMIKEVFAKGETSVEIVAAIEKATVALTKKGDEFLDLTLVDKSGSMNAKVWSVSPEEKALFKANTVVHIEEMMLGDYNGQVQGAVNKKKKYEVVKNANLSDYIEKLAPAIDIMKKDFADMMHTLPNEHQEIIRDAMRVVKNGAEKYMTMPAGSAMHHSQENDLLYHSLTMMKLADNIAKANPIYDRDALVVSAALHDFFKTVEYDYTSAEEGAKLNRWTLLGSHINMAIMFLTDEYKKGKISEELFLKVGNIIMAHHGEFHKLKPATREANLFKYILKMLPDGIGYEEKSDANASKEADGIINELSEPYIGLIHQIMPDIMKVGVTCSELTFIKMIKAAVDTYPTINGDEVVASAILYVLLTSKKHAKFLNKNLATLEIMEDYLEMMDKYPGGVRVLISYVLANRHSAKVIDTDSFLEMTHILATATEDLYGDIESCPEAIILHNVDMIDSRMYMYEKDMSRMEQGQLSDKKNFGTDARTYSPVTREYDPY